MTRAGTAARVSAWALCLAVAVPAAIAAHRLDEYLQAIRIDIGFDRVLLQIDLTPGAEISSGIIATLDSNGDGEIAAPEADGYATLVLNHVWLAVDGERRPLSVERRQVPSISEMAAGTGVIRIESTAIHSAAADGPHTLEIHNDFRPDVGVYLVNALIPAASEITITAQRRDPLQRTLTLDYEIARRSSGWARLSWTLVAVAIILGSIWSRKRKFKVKS